MSTTTKSHIKGLDLSYVLVENPQKAIEFYRDVMGLTPSMVDPDGKGAEFDLADGQTFGVWSSGDGKTGAGVFFAVDDINAAIEELRGRGLRVSPADETPVCFMAFGADPEGNGFGIHQRKKA